MARHEKQPFVPDVGPIKNGVRLRAVRWGMGLTLAEARELIGYKGDSLSSIENDTVPQSQTSLERISSAYGYTPEKLFAIPHAQLQKWATGLPPSQKFREQTTPQSQINESVIETDLDNHGNDLDRGEKERKLFDNKSYLSMTYGILTYMGLKNPPKRGFKFIDLEPGYVMRLNPSINSREGIIGICESLIRECDAEISLSRNPETIREAQTYEKHVREYLRGFGLAALWEGDFNTAVDAYSIAVEGGISQNEDAMRRITEHIIGNPNDAMQAIKRIVEAQVKYANSSYFHPVFPSPEIEGELMTFTEIMDDYRLEYFAERGITLHTKRGEFANLLKAFQVKKQTETQAMYNSLFDAKE